MNNATVGSLILALTLFTPIDYSLIYSFSVFILVFPYLIKWTSATRGSTSKNEICFNFGMICVIYSFAIFSSIIINGRIFVYQDYMEFLLLSKFFGTYYIFYLISNNSIDIKKFNKHFLFIIGIYFILCFGQIYNYYLDSSLGFFYELYTPAHHQDATDILRLRGEANRFTGLSGNPNAFGAMVLILLIAVFKFRYGTISLIVYSSVGVILLILSQSRTVFIAFTIACLLIMLRKRARFNRYALLLLFFLVFSAAYFASYQLNLTFISSLFDTSIITSESLEVRAFNWNRLFQMIIQNPIFGHAPRQEFFANSGFNPDSEYILTAWRYGFFGFLALVLLLIYPIRLILGNKVGSKQDRFGILILVTATLVISLTNVTFSDHRFSVIYAFVFGISMGKFMQPRQS